MCPRGLALATIESFNLTNGEMVFDAITLIVIPHSSARIRAQKARLKNLIVASDRYAFNAFNAIYDNEKTGWENSIFRNTVVISRNL